MRNLFIAIVNMSISAGFAAIVVMLLRLALKRAPKAFSYALWAVVLFRLICPLSFESAFSLMPVNSDAILNDIAYAANPIIGSSAAFVDGAVFPDIQNALQPGGQAAGVDWLGSVIDIGSYIWLAGILLILGYSAFTYIVLRQRLGSATLVTGNIYETDRISTPFVLGFLHPGIYLPLGLTDDERDYILRHEATHIRRGDYLIKPLGFLALTLHWFNPLIWLSFRLMCRDMEMSCDEHVLGQCQADIRAKYSGSLLALSMKQSGLLSPLAFGEPDAKKRIKNVLSYKRPSFWISTTAVVAIAAVGYSLLANPVRNGAYVKRYPGEYNTRLSDYSNISVKDAEGKDISNIAIDLWYCANEIYNVDDMLMFEAGEYEAVLAQFAMSQSNELLNYYPVVHNVFTKNGILQLERTNIGGPEPLIRKVGDKVYRLSAWKTGYSFAYALTDMQVRELRENMITLAVTYAFVDFEGIIHDYETVDFTITNESGKWLVEDYVYPETYNNVPVTA